MHRSASVCNSFSFEIFAEVNRNNHNHITQGFIVKVDPGVSEDWFLSEPETGEGMTGAGAKCSESSVRSLGTSLAATSQQWSVIMNNVELSEMSV